MLLPDYRGENRFVIVSTPTARRFFIASNSLRSMERLHSFFFRLYGMVSEASTPPEGYTCHMVLRNSRKNRKIGEFYHPGFLRNLTDLGSVGQEMESMYMVSIRSGPSFRKNTRFNFTARLSFKDSHNMVSVSDIVASEVRTIRKKHGWKFIGGRVHNSSDNLLSETTNLINFIRIPAESDFVI